MSSTAMGEVDSDRSALEALTSNVHIMDGSMGHLCLERGIPQDSKLWSARGLVEDKYHPIVVQAHMDYIRAGATMITTNNYAVQPNYYRAVFRDWEARIQKDTELAARLAVEARRKCGAETSVRILGSLPPICQTCRPDETEKFIREFGEEACVKIYRLMGQALLCGGVDAFIAESMNSWDEARLVIKAVGDLGAPMVISMGPFRSMDLKPQPHLAPEVASKVLDAKANGVPVEAFGFNCAAPEEILISLEALETTGLKAQLREAGVRLVAYANCNDNSYFIESGFDLQACADAPAKRPRKDLQGSSYVRWCDSFMRAGVSYCGGCCGTSPAEIAELRKIADEAFTRASARASASGA